MKRDFLRVVMMSIEGLEVRGELEFEEGVIEYRATVKEGVTYEYLGDTYHIGIKSDLEVELSDSGEEIKYKPVDVEKLEMRYFQKDKDEGTLGIVEGIVDKVYKTVQDNLIQSIESHSDKIFLSRDTEVIKQQIKNKYENYK